MKTTKKAFTVIIALIALSAVISCDKYNYTDALQRLGKRVEILEKQMFDINTDLTALQTVVIAVEERGFATEVVHNDDGTYTITFNNGQTVTLRNGKEGKNGKDGRDGREIEFLISVDKDKDGKWYWTLNGEWILNDNGDKMPVTGADGKNGQDGRDGQNGKDGANGKDGQDGQNNPLSPAIVPQVRINEETRFWEISTDGGQTWKTTGVLADGKDGKDGQDGQDGKDGYDGKDGKDGQDGKNGQNGQDGKNGKDGKDGVDGKDGQDGKNGADDIFVDIIEAKDGSSITFVLADGRTFTVPIVE